VASAGTARLVSAPASASSSPRFERGHRIPRSLLVAECVDQHAAPGRIAELGKRVRDVEPRDVVRVIEVFDERGASARAEIGVVDGAGNRTQRERGRAGHLRIAIAEHGDQQIERAAAVDLGERRRGLKPQVGRTLAERLGERLEAVGVAQRAERDRRVLAHRWGAVVEPLDQPGQRSRIAEIAERAARLGTDFGPIVLDRDDQRIDRTMFLRRVGEITERVRGKRARLRTALDEVAQRGVERDRRARKQVRHARRLAQN